jgi:succinate dehydrogenase / fumarate reductase, cytochrome b subunit
MTASGSAVGIRKADIQFILRRLHSLSGVVPIGGFLLFHFYENASARRGAEAFNETVRHISEMPYLVVLEWAGLLLPILFHSIYGLSITASSRPNVIRHSYGRNWAYLFQRISGMVAFGYLFFHVINTRMWAIFVKGGNITFEDMQQKLAHPYQLLIYFLGIVAVTYHFSNGIWSFSITWGLVRSERGQQQLARATLLLFLVLCLVGLDILSAFVLDKSFFTRIGI